VTRSPLNQSCPFFHALAAYYLLLVLVLVLVLVTNCTYIAGVEEKMYSNYNYNAVIYCKTTYNLHKPRYVTHEQQSIAI